MFPERCRQPLVTPLRPLVKPPLRHSCESRNPGPRGKPGACRGRLFAGCLPQDPSQRDCWAIPQKSFQLPYGFNRYKSST